jgi:hypothetical protein
VCLFEAGQLTEYVANIVLHISTKDNVASDFEVVIGLLVFTNSLLKIIVSIP